MKLSLAWMSEYVHPGMDPWDLAERLSETGTEVAGVQRFGIGAAGFEHLVVGRVVSCDPHPDADRLRVTTVDVGEPTPVQIVCGAPNVAANITVAVARPGTVMPDGTKLKTAKLRGVQSAGMIVSEDELGFGDQQAGIMVLPEGIAAPGTLVAELFEVGTEVLDLELTPNRPDCLGIYGMAREVHAATGSPLQPPPWSEIDLPATGTIDGLAIDVTVPDRCPRFTAIAYDNVTVAPAPRWMRARLAAAGQRPINNVVDITNYVMLITGQPLHAFDLDQIVGGQLTVRCAVDGETITTLDGQERTLDTETVLIEDAEGPTSIAGIMGGARSEVTPATTRVLMEAATWHGPTINRTSWKLNLRSEASSRFEKGLAPEQTLEAQALALRLMVELTGATVRPVLADVGGAGPQPLVLRLRDVRVTQLLGVSISAAEQEGILRTLDFDVATASDGLDVTVPAFRRNDVTREADLIEEVARVYGVDRLPDTLPARRGAAGRLSPRQALRRRAEDTLVGCGLRGVMGWSFTHEGALDRLRLPVGDRRRSTVALANPMSEEHALLRPNLLISLLDVAAHNVARAQSDLRLFERGTVFSPSVTALPADEHDHLGVLLTGASVPATWGNATPAPADAFAVKGVLEALATRLGVSLTVVNEVHPMLHSGRSASVICGEETVGWLGEVHPLVAAAWEIDAPVAAFELDLGAVITHAVNAESAHRYTDLTSFPAVRQDLAVVLDADISAARVIEVTRAAGGALLRHAEVFDVYVSEQLGVGKRSLALHLQFRADDRTLTDDDADAARAAILEVLESELGAVARG